LARDGVWLGGIVPYGYRVVGKDKEARLHIADEVNPDTSMSEADVVRLMYRMAGDEGLSCTVIAARLNAQGVPTSYTRDGEPCCATSASSAQGHLARRAGAQHAGRDDVQGPAPLGQAGQQAPRERDQGGGHRAHSPCLVDEDLWQRAQETLHRNRLIPSNVEKRLYLCAA
jgi:site-specific DNA recombinase